MSEKEINQQVARIVREGAPLRETLQRIQGLLQNTSAVASLALFRGTDCSFAKDENISAFLYSRQFPFRGVYTAKLSRGVLVLCFGSTDAPSPRLQALVEHIGAQLISEMTSEAERSPAYQAA